MTYHGKPCARCGGTERYSANYKCRACARRDQRASHDASRERERKRAQRARARELAGDVMGALCVFAIPVAVNFLQFGFSS